MKVLLIDKEKNTIEIELDSYLMSEIKIENVKRNNNLKELDKRIREFINKKGE